MPKRLSKFFFVDILESVEKIQDYTAELSYEEFMEDKKTVDAVIRNFEIIGEATKNIPKELRNKYINVPWHNMVGMRNILAHDYYEVGLEIVWSTIKEDIPMLALLMKNVLKDFKEDE